MSHMHKCPICGHMLDDRDKDNIGYFDNWDLAHKECIRKRYELYAQGDYDDYGDPDPSDYF